MRLVTAVFCLALLSACGRYLPPVAPELLSPSAIQFVSAVGDGEGVTFTWKVSATDMQGKKLKQIDGYRIYRADYTESKTISLKPQEIEYRQIGFIEDKHLEELKALQDQAEAQGQIVRKVKVDEIKKQFTFRDSEVTQNKVYLYKIVPVNQGSVEGGSSHLYRVTFLGPQSSVELIPDTESAARFSAQ